MVVLIDTVSPPPVRPRHPEKVNRPDALSPPKPDWIRVRAPNTRGYADTRKTDINNVSGFGVLNKIGQAGSTVLAMILTTRYAVEAAAISARGNGPAPYVSACLDFRPALRHPV